MTPEHHIRGCGKKTRIFWKSVYVKYLYILEFLISRNVCSDTIRVAFPMWLWMRVTKDPDKHLCVRLYVLFMCWLKSLEHLCRYVLHLEVLYI